MHPTGQPAGWRPVARPALAAAVLLILPLAAAPAHGQAGGEGDVLPQDAPATGRQIYDAACANCHGADGAGAPKSHVGFDTPLPDFTSCNFASREPTADWVAVAHQGGPVRGFGRVMPAFGELLSPEELERAIDYIRGFCGNDDWPRGELNLPRAMFTEKAYPEDEAVWTTTVPAEGNAAVMNEIVYERRFGARNQLEVVAPFSFRDVSAEGEPADWNGGLGDMALGWKRVLFHGLDSGSILSLTGEVILPTGDESDGFGNGTATFEPFLSYGQILPDGFFAHAQAGAEIPADADRTEEGFWRAAVGRTFTSGAWGRAWSPMVEVLGSRELAEGEPTNWDVVPQLQVTLNTRQHVMGNVAVRIPVTDTDVRQTELLVYVLWDYFDGGFFAGW